MQIQKLTSLIVEPTNTCNLRCTFCFVTEGMTRPGGFMDFALFRKIIDDTPELEHLVLHNWGEPFLHPDLFRMIEYAADAGVRHVVMNTNGTLLTDAAIDRIISGPLSILRFSIDGSPETFQRIRGVAWKKVRERLYRLRELKTVRRPALQVGVVFTVDATTESEAESYIEYWAQCADHVRLQAKLISAPRTSACPEPFGKDYGKLVVLWDGAVVPCCVDRNGTLALGNARTQRVADLWYSAEMEELRRKHRVGDFPPTCAECGECRLDNIPPRFVIPGDRAATGVGPELRS
jgi:radical SAM protein with 4Fe4S-binding SPASM domain